MSKQKSFHFSLGNSTSGPVGFCVRVTAKNSKEALAKVKKAIEWFNAELDVAKSTGLRGEDKDIEYFHVYFSPEAISEKDIDEVNPVEEVA